jgi:HlyD family secretion protein
MRAKSTSMFKRMGYLFTLAVPLVVAGLAVAWMLDLRTDGNSATSYETATVSTGSIRKIVSSSGPVRALVTVSVGSQLSGQIDKVLVDFNSEVTPGQVLATLDARTYAALVEKAKADLAAAKAIRVTQTAALVKAQASLRLAHRTIERQQTLADKGFSAQSSLDSAIRDEEIAKAEIEVANAQIESATANIAQREAALDQAQIDLDRAEIRSPVSGTVISRTVDPGQTVAASLQAPELFKIAQDLSHIRIEAQVNEADVGAVAQGNVVTFTVDAYPEREFKGMVTQVRLAATELNNVVTYTVIIEAGNDDRRLFPGMTANVQIESATHEGVLRVPNDVFRFKPRGATAAASSSPGGGQRAERLVTRLTNEVELTAEQEAMARAEITALGQEMRSGAPAGMSTPSFDPAAFRQKLAVRLDQVLLPSLNDEQRRAYEKWKQGRETARFATLWLIGPNGQPENRSVRTGLADEFTEILGTSLKEGDQIIVRAREAKP